MNPDRVVIDTTCLVSASFKPDGNPAKVVKVARERYEIVLSPETLDELENVFHRSKFDRFDPQGKRFEFLEAFVNVAAVHDQTVKIQACIDPKDDKFLSLAASCGAKTIVSGDKHLKDMHPFDGIEILSPADFLERELEREKSQGSFTDRLLTQVKRERQRQGLTHDRDDLDGPDF